MIMTKRELKEMIRECLREELSKTSMTEGAFSGGYAQGGALDTAKRAGGQVKVWKDALDGKKTKTVKAKDLKPGMITSTGEVKRVTDIGWSNGKPSVEVSYGGIGAQGSHASDVVAADRDYEVLDEAIAGNEFTTYTYDEWLQGVEAAHSLYSEFGDYYKNPLWSRAMEIAACENLYKDLVAYMDAWMKHEGSNNFPHKSYAKHLEEDAESMLENTFSF